ncbi:glutamine synthetase [Microbispora triticiradicis]|uniref:Glutamine synthetase n=3 Tax=Microbispora TaxID=2005 RepID=A0ABY3LV62_9ACTN|nr:MULTISPECIES: glutamine synthetase family protein [Microbispora]RGA04726.1 glutamine synthetase [Microbispora triticiradicis]TLP52375.1 glutamine synthetase [Microbispora fusca]TYB55459.1 glutamine synthetase [Microbispora tritici]GLW20617.1 glutamine synthetase [Microbispora amethystogenes]
MTGIDDFLNRQGRADDVAHARKLIDTFEIEYIYVQYVTVTGRVVGKGMPAAHWERVAERGVQLVYGSTANVSAGRTGRYLGYGPEASELVAVPEPDTFARLPWDGRVARVFARLFRNREEEHEPGAPLTSDCRGNLARMTAGFADRHGLELRIGTEPEMMWLRREGAELVGASKPYCYHIDQFEELRDVMLRVLRYAREMGLDMIQGDHEDAPGQLELNFAFDEPLRNADRLITYRQICRQVAREFDLVACFMTKPFMGLSASGCHHNFSLWSGGEDAPMADAPDAVGRNVAAYRRGGRNLFPRADGAGLSEEALHSIGGVLAHLPALTALAASTVNSYRRMWDSGLWAPFTRGWGHQNRTCALRVSAPDRIEYRAADSMVNPYLMAAGLLAAVGDGLRSKLPAGEPTTANTYESDAARADRLPMNLGEALAALHDDALVRSALHGDLYSVFRDHKQDEWERFLATTTSWDFDAYLDYVP